MASVATFDIHISSKILITFRHDILGGITNSVETVLMSQHLCGKYWKRAVVIVCYRGDLAESISRQWVRLFVCQKELQLGRLR